MFVQRWRGRQRPQKRDDQNDNANDIHPIITDQLSNTNFKKVLDLLQSNDIENDLFTQILNSFCSDDLLTLIVADNVVMQISNDAELVPGRSGKIIKMTMLLNGSKLRNSSQEYIAATIIHELFHANDDIKDLKANVPIKSELAQHQAMALTIDTHVGYLQKLFPKLPLKDAQALIIGGFRDIEDNDDKTFKTKRVVSR